MTIGVNRYIRSRSISEHTYIHTTTISILYIRQIIFPCIILKISCLHFTLIQLRHSLLSMSKFLYLFLVYLKTLLNCVGHSPSNASVIVSDELENM
jgi:hypothetical protein